MRLFRFLLSFSLLYMSYGLAAQTIDKGVLRVYIQPNDAIIRLDSLHLTYGKSIKLDSGTYLIEAWAPKRELVEKEVKIVPNLYKTVRIKLPYCKAYKEYRFKNNIQNSKRYLLRYGPAAAYLFYASIKLGDIHRLEKSSDQLYDETQSYKKQFETAFFIEEIQRNRSLYNDRKSKYDQQIDEINDLWKEVQIGAGITAVATFLSWKLASKVKKPTYTETPLLSRVQWSPRWSSNLKGMKLQLQF